MLTEPFIQRALLTALALGPLCALLGVFVTSRGMAFFSDTVAHGAILGIALGFWWNLSDPTLPITGTSLVVAALFLWLQRRTELTNDTIMALLLAGSVSLGMVILTRHQAYRGELHRFLFGDILSVGWQDVALAVSLLGVTFFWVFRRLSELSLITANAELAHIAGIPVHRVNGIFLLLLTAVVAVSIRLTGIILVTSLLVIPAATARNVCRNLRLQIILSISVGLIGAVGGVIGSAHFARLPTGPTIVLCCIALFILSLFGKSPLHTAPSPAPPNQ